MTREDEKRLMDEVHALDVRAWNAIGPAYLSALPLCIAAPLSLALYVDGHRAPAVMLILLAAAIAYPWWKDWRDAVRACERKTAELRERRLRNTSETK